MLARPPQAPVPARKGTTAKHHHQKKCAGSARARYARSAVPNPRAKAKLSLGTLSAVALLELLTAAAPARIVTADVLPFGLHDRTRRTGGRGRPAAAHGERRRRTRATPSGRDRLRPGERLMLVLEPAAVHRLTLLRALE